MTLLFKCCSLLFTSIVAVFLALGVRRYLDSWTEMDTLIEYAKQDLAGEHVQSFGNVEVTGEVEQRQEDNTSYAFQVPYDEEQIADLRQQLSRFLSRGHQTISQNHRIVSDHQSHSSGGTGKEEEEWEKQWETGVPVDELKRLVNYWKDEFDWKTKVEELNQLSHFRTKINGLMIHYIHMKAEAKSKSKTEAETETEIETEIEGKTKANAKAKADGEDTQSKRNVTTVILVHGWPGSFIEFCNKKDIIDPLLEAGYDVVIPSIPGFGYSETPHQPGFTVVEAAIIFIKLMRRVMTESDSNSELGSSFRIPGNEYACQGGDWGSLICSAMAQMDSLNVKGVHLNMVVANPPLSIGGPLQWVGTLLAPHWWFSLFGAQHEVEKITPLLPFLIKTVKRLGYFYVQATQPDIIGVALIDSPAAQLVWLLDKFHHFTDHKNQKADLAHNCHPYPEEKGTFRDVSKENFFSNLMVYWTTSTGLSSARFYYEGAQGIHSDLATISLLSPITKNVPVGVADFPGEVFRPPSFWLRSKYPNMISYHTFPCGGHFAAMEKPKFFIQDLLQFLQKL